MRDIFVAELMKMASDDPSVVLMTGDLGFGVLTPFAEKFPDQFVNAGVAEQNMAGMAAGLALEGRRVFTYSIANFPTLRCLEQIRNDICYHDLDVTIVSVGGGFAYGALGMSHHATEDLAILRALPNLAVLAPGDPVEVSASMSLLKSHKGPAYLRLGRASEEPIHTTAVAFDMGMPLKVIEGKDIAILSTGGILDAAMGSLSILSESNIYPSVYSVPCLSPFDYAAIKKIAKDHALIVTIEEHTCIGGLGGAVAEVVAEMPGIKAQLTRFGLPNCYTSRVGDQEYLRKNYGLSSSHIAERLLSQWAAIQEVSFETII